MKSISIRDFQRNFYKHVKLAEDIVVTKSDKEAFFVVFPEHKATNVVTNVIKTKEDVVTMVNGVTNYGCGCIKDASLLCPKHKRL